MVENPKIFKRIVSWRESCDYWSKCNALYVNGFFSTSSTNLWKVHIDFHFVHIEFYLVQTEFHLMQIDMEKV